MHKQVTIRPRNIVALLKIVSLAKDERDWGLLTGSGAIPNSNIEGSDFVWPHAAGKTKGTYSITPLYSEVVYTSENDHNLHVALLLGNGLKDL